MSDSDLIRRGDAAKLLCAMCREGAPRFDRFGPYHGEGDRRYLCWASAVYALPAAVATPRAEAPAAAGTGNTVHEIECQEQLNELLRTTEGPVTVRVYPWLFAGVGVPREVHVLSGHVIAAVPGARIYADAAKACSYANADGAVAHATVAGARAYAIAKGSDARATAKGAIACAVASGASAHATVEGALAYKCVDGALAFEYGS